MKIRIIILSFMVLCVSMGGCGGANMVQKEFYPNGNLKSIKEVSVSRVGSGKLKDTEVDIVSGKAKIGSREGDIGNVSSVIEKAIDRIPIPPIIP